MEMKSKSGFTVIELMAVIAVMGLIITIGMPTITQFIYRMRVMGATQALASRLQLARQMAITDKVRYVFNYDLTKGSYWVFKDDNENWVRDAGEKLVGPYVVGEESPGVFFSPAIPPYPLGFTPQGTIINSVNSIIFGSFHFYEKRWFKKGSVLVRYSGFISTKEGSY